MIICKVISLSSNVLKNVNFLTSQCQPLLVIINYTVNIQLTHAYGKLSMWIFVQFYIVFKYLRIIHYIIVTIIFSCF